MGKERKDDKKTGKGKEKKKRGGKEKREEGETVGEKREDGRTGIKLEKREKKRGVKTSMGKRYETSVKHKKIKCEEETTGTFLYKGRAK